MAASDVLPKAASQEPIYGALSEKAQAEEELIANVIKNNKFLQEATEIPALDSIRASQLARVARKETVEKGCDLILEGAQGDSFYIVANGKFQVSKGAQQLQVFLTTGSSFGELALLHSKPRSATVTAVETSEVWSITRRDFRGLLMKAPADEKLISEAIKNNKFLQESTEIPPLDAARTTALARSARKEYVETGRALIEEGGVNGHSFYIVASGKFQVSVGGKLLDVFITEGRSFGELALLHLKPRSATVTAVQPSEVWVINRTDFRALLMKAPEDEALISNIINNNKFLQASSEIPPLDEARRKRLARAARKETVEQGRDLIQEGDTNGDSFYIVTRGKFQIAVGGKLLEVFFTPGSSFGELALLNSKPRSATVTAVAESEVWVISRQDFRDILMKAPADEELIAKVIKNNKFLQESEEIPPLDGTHTTRLARAAYKQTITKGHALIREGDTNGDSFYIVASGKFLVSTKCGNKQAEKQARRSSFGNQLTGRPIFLEAASSFGELALLLEQPRSATVTAVEESEVWVINRKDFKLILMKAPEEEEFISNAIKANKFLQESSEIDASRTLQLARVARKETVEKGFALIKQGQGGGAAECFYIVSTGKFKVTMTGTWKEIILSAGSSFGELALLSEKPRSATVTAVVRSEVWVINRRDFRNILMKPPEDHDFISSAISKNKFLQETSKIGATEAMALAKIARKVMVQKGYALIQEGDHGDSFYIVNAGKFQVSIAGATVEVFESLSRVALIAGSSFGELALLHSKPRSATITAVEDSEVWVISRRDFKDILMKISDATVRRQRLAELAPASPKRCPRAALYSENCNRMCQFESAGGNVDEAEAWMNKMLASGSDPQLESLKELLRAWAANGRLTKMEEWFAKAASPALYPEMNLFQLDAACYNIVALAFAEAGDTVRSEQYAREMQSLGFQINQKCYTALARCYLQKNDPRRAHAWCLEMVEGAGFKKPNKAVLLEVIRSLADQGNVSSANKWLGYMFDNNIRADDETYDYVRRAHPAIIIPTQLSGESWSPVPPLIKPVTLNGEGIVRRELKEKVWAGPKHTPRHHLSSLTERERRSRRPLAPLKGPSSARITSPSKTTMLLPPLESASPGAESERGMATTS